MLLIFYIFTFLIYCLNKLYITLDVFFFFLREVIARGIVSMGDFFIQGIFASGEGGGVPPTLKFLYMIISTCLTAETIKKPWY